MCGSGEMENPKQDCFMMLLCRQPDAHDADAHPSVQAQSCTYVCVYVYMYVCMYVCVNVM